MRRPCNEPNADFEMRESNYGTLAWATDAYSSLKPVQFRNPSLQGPCVCVTRIPVFKPIYKNAHAKQTICNYNNLIHRPIYTWSA